MFRQVYLGYLPVWIKGEGSNGSLEFTGGRIALFISILFFFLFTFFFLSSIPFPDLFIFITADGATLALFPQRVIDSMAEVGGQGCFKFTCFDIEYY